MRERGVEPREELQCLPAFEAEVRAGGEVPCTSCYASLNRGCLLRIKNKPGDGMNTVKADSATLYQWSQLKAEPLKGGLTRKLISTDRLMIAHVHFDKGDEVPTHAHENEQITYILEGALKFWLGAEGEREVVVRAGEVLVIPSQLPHRALALEATLDMDVFNPPRQDWLDGTDSYIRR